MGRSGLARFIPVVLLALAGAGHVAFAESETTDPKNVTPRLGGTSATCDLGFMDEFYNELKGGVCLNGSLLESECLKFSASEAVGMIPWVMGIPGRVAAVLIGTSAIQTRDGYLEDETPQQTVGRNRLRQGGISCDQPYNKYINTRLDHQVREGELERPDPEDEEDEEDAPVSTRGMTAAQRAAAERRAREARLARERAKQQTAAQRQGDLSWWCAPYYGAHNTALSRKNIEFLQLPEGKRRELLCAHPELRDYYQRLMEPYTARLRAQTKIVGLQCDGDNGMRFVAENGGKQTVFEVKYSPLGNYESVLTSPLKPEDSAAYRKWRADIEFAKRLGHPIPESFLLNGAPTSLVPGRFLFNFRDSNNGSQLTTVNLINGGLGANTSRVVATLEAARFESVIRKMGSANPHAELDVLARNYQMFNLRANEAKACCLEPDNRKRQSCVKELDQIHLTPAQAAPPGTTEAATRRGGTRAARPGRK